MRPWLVWAIGAALLIAAWGVVQVTPDDDVATQPFSVAAEVGRAVESRGLAVTVTDVRLGESAAAAGWRADGTWLVIDLEAAARGDERAARLEQAALVLDGVTYRASERPPSLFSQALTIDLPRAGSIAFELPADAASRTAVLQLGLDVETRLDSVVELPIDLAALDPQREV